jgi:hypothetical protein
MAACVSSAPRKCSLTPGAISSNTLSRGVAGAVGCDPFAGAPEAGVGTDVIRARLEALLRREGTRRVEGGFDRNGAATAEGVEEDGYRLNGNRGTEAAGSGEAYDDEGFRCVVGRVTSGETDEEDCMLP